MHLLDKSLGHKAIEAYTKAAHRIAGRNESGQEWLTSVGDEMNGVVGEAGLHTAYHVGLAFAIYTDTDTFCVRGGVLSACHA